MIVPEDEQHRSTPSLEDPYECLFSPSKLEQQPPSDMGFSREFADMIIEGSKYYDFCWKSCLNNKCPAYKANMEDSN